MSKQQGNRGVSIKGLANIGALLNRTDLPTTTTAPKRERRDTNQIYHRTREKIQAAVNDLPGSPDVIRTRMQLIETYLLAGLREAYNGGHADALDQNSAVEKLLEQQYDARTKMTLPAAVAWIMEGRGLSSMTLDLAHLATVFDRQKIDFDVSDGEIITYRLTPADEV
jgi:hypothetical protein